MGDPELIANSEVPLPWVTASLAGADDIAEGDRSQDEVAVRLIGNAGGSIDKVGVGRAHLQVLRR